jgi:LPS O-antigen subunit length determinant protein (WzzB/FepE family)
MLPAFSPSVSPPSSVSTSITSQSMFTTKALNRKEQSSSSGNDNFLDLKFYLLHHNHTHVVIIEAVKWKDNSVYYQLLYLNPNQNSVNYYNAKGLYNKLSKKFQNLYSSLHNILNSQTEQKKDIINSSSKKMLVSSLLSLTSVTSSSLSLVLSQKTVIVKSNTSTNAPDELDRLLRWR